MVDRWDGTGDESALETDRAAGVPDWDEQTDVFANGSAGSSHAGRLLRVAHSPAGAAFGPVPIPIGRPLRIGRGPNADLRIADPNMSRDHARIECDGPGQPCRIVDAASANGAFVNGQRIRSALIKSADVVRLGASFLIFDEPDQFGAIGPLVRALAPSVQPLLLQGDTGTGKDFLARDIHQASGRAGPFVVINCAALGENIGEAELFGHVRGAFTGADAGRTGLLASARGGTLLLNEFRELPRSLQPKLLRVIETRKVRPLGSDREVSVDVRFLAATNVDLAKEVKRSKFSLDLYARFLKPALFLPPLRERRARLPTLLSDLSAEMGLTARPNVEALELLLLLPWSANVRELQQLLFTLKAFGPSCSFDVAFLERYADGARELAAKLRGRPLISPRPAPAIPQIRPPATRPPASSSASSKSEFSADRLVRALRSTRGIVSQAAKTLGVSRRHLYRLLHDSGMSADDFRGCPETSR